MSDRKEDPFMAVDGQRCDSRKSKPESNGYGSETDRGTRMGRVGQIGPPLNADQLIERGLSGPEGGRYREVSFANARERSDALKAQHELPAVDGLSAESR